MYKELVKQLRSTVSRSKRTLFDDAADAIEQLQKELREERYRHDRLQDFEVAEAEQLHQMRVERNMLAEKLREKESVLSLLRQGKQQWISVKDRLPEKRDVEVLVIATGKGGNVRFEEAYAFACYSGKDGWALDEYPEIESPKIDWWMPLPEPPEEGSHDL